METEYEGVDSNPTPQDNGVVEKNWQQTHSSFVRLSSVFKSVSLQNIEVLDVGTSLLSEDRQLTPQKKQKSALHLGKEVLEAGHTALVALGKTYSVRQKRVSTPVESTYSATSDQALHSRNQLELAKEVSQVSKFFIGNVWLCGSSTNGTVGTSGLSQVFLQSIGIVDLVLKEVIQACPDDQTRKDLQAFQERVLNVLV